MRRIFSTPSSPSFFFTLPSRLSNFSSELFVPPLPTIRLVQTFSAKIKHLRFVLIPSPPSSAWASWSCAPCSAAAAPSFSSVCQFVFVENKWRLNGLGPSILCGTAEKCWICPDKISQAQYNDIQELLTGSLRINFKWSSQRRTKERRIGSKQNF